MIRPLRTRVKFCGLRRPEDVALASRLGADAVGFVCHPASPRYVEPARLRDLAAALGPFTTPVLLFVDTSPARIEEVLREVPAALLQFHGRESPADCQVFGRPYLRAVAAAGKGDLLELASAFQAASGLLVDAPIDTRQVLTGGSGKTFDWSLVPPRAQRKGFWVLAGGLNPDNVGEAIARVAPDAVDVSSGIEETRGVKCARLMHRFMVSVQEADRLLAAGGSYESFEHQIGGQPR